MPNQSLLSETIEALALKGKDPAWVAWVEVQEDRISYCSWEEFCAFADAIIYDRNSYEGPLIPPSLKVVGQGWWLERWEYDGSEGWRYRQVPSCPSSEDVPKLKGFKPGAFGWEPIEG